MERVDPIEVAARKRGIPLEWGFRSKVGRILAQERLEEERQRIHWEEDRIVEAITVPTWDLEKPGEHVCHFDVDERELVLRHMHVRGEVNILRYLVSLMPVTWEGRRLNQHTVLEWDEDGIWMFKLDVSGWPWSCIHVTCLGRKRVPGESGAIVHNKRP